VPLSPEQRSQRARIAALTRWSREDPAAGTKKARDAFLQRFLDEVPTDLPETERMRRALAARKAHMLGLSLRSSKARARRAS
jgi:hypothetical protein